MRARELAGGGGWVGGWAEEEGGRERLEAEAEEGTSGHGNGALDNPFPDRTREIANDASKNRRARDERKSFSKTFEKVA